MRIRSKLLSIVLIAAGSMLVLAPTCYVQPPSGNKSPAVPYVQQEGSLYCTAAAVLAWRLHDGYAGVPQLEILQAMGGSPQYGAAEQAIPGGVNYYTNTRDARHEYGAGGAYSDDQGRFFSRQITSINNGVPVIAITEGGFHVVVVDGGSWHTTNNNRVWDTAEFMDPAFGFSTVSASALVSLMCPTDYISCRQVIGGGASSAGNSNYGSYGSSTYMDGVPECQHCTFEQY